MNKEIPVEQEKVVKAKQSYNAFGLVHNNGFLFLTKNIKKCLTGQKYGNYEIGTNVVVFFKDPCLTKSIEIRTH